MSSKSPRVSSGFDLDAPAPQTQSTLVRLLLSVCLALILILGTVSIGLWVTLQDRTKERDQIESERAAHEGTLEDLDKLTEQLQAELDKIESKNNELETTNTELDSEVEQLRKWREEAQARIDILEMPIEDMQRLEDTDQILSIPEEFQLVVTLESEIEEDRLRESLLRESTKLIIEEHGIAIVDSSPFVIVLRVHITDMDRGGRRYNDHYRVEANSSVYFWVESPIDNMKMAAEVPDSNYVGGLKPDNARSNLDYVLKSVEYATNSICERINASRSEYEVDPESAP